MKNSASVVFIIVLLSSAFIAQAQADKLDDIIESGSLRCAVTLDFPPMGFRDEKNTPAGFDVDYCNDLAKTLGVKAEIVETPFPDRIPALVSGRADVIAVVIRPGKIDRSPCGTGCSARMAVLHAKGQLAVGEVFIGRSIIGSEFHCRIDSTTEIAGRPAIIPCLSRRAWITGTHQHLLDPSDPWPSGYRLSDTWPVELTI